MAYENDDPRPPAARRPRLATDPPSIYDDRASEPSEATTRKATDPRSEVEMTVEDLKWKIGSYAGSISTYRLLGWVYLVLIATGSYYVGTALAQTCVILPVTDSLLCRTDSGLQIVYVVSTFVGGVMVLIPIFAVARTLEAVNGLLVIEANRQVDRLSAP